MGRYSLAEHVYVCVNDEHVVLLDLKEDRYWALAAAATTPLAGVVPGWPVRSLDAPMAGSSNPEQAEEIAAGLVEQGILVGESTGGKDATPVRIVAPTRELLSGGDDPAGHLPHAPRAGRAMAGNLLLAALSARLSLRLRAFEKVVRGFSTRKLKAGARAPDMERTRELVAAFFRLRVFFFSSRSECLFDSLTLLKFLAHYGIFADWVFGVQARPFAAHCWVQLGDVVLNDTVEHVSGYTPIMLV
jgi:hypothetical protein